MKRPILAAALALLSPLAATADPAPQRACTFDSVCAPGEGCSDMAAFTQFLDAVPDGGGWVWITEAGGVTGETVSAPDDTTLTVLFPPHEAGMGTLLLTVTASGAAAMTQHGTHFESGDAVATSYFGTCATQ
ncbi:hypothetical protein P1J78_07205 [Psychromarinibacter sp. C21-152]|uniref:Uncharacterized protein n=1 Tax=Psychromarinibacter sediminicola TaxID=3033385 RepID=A0AAE3NMD1_9RHOB|nr:hypothetical protein [Psychromarinibacter sediminicola]MDF0600513.1 hypothetical protein [Psychromarinibacter sediminicola]